MLELGTAKKQRRTGGEDEEEEISQVDSMVTPNPHSLFQRLQTDLTSCFPPIYTKILSSTSQSALVSLLRTNSFNFNTVAPLLYTDIRIGHQQLKRLLMTGAAAVQAGDRSSFPYGHTECLKFVRSLHLRDYRYKFNASLDLLGHYSLKVPNMVIYPTVRWNGYWTPYLAGLLEVLRTSHLYVRFSPLVPPSYASNSSAARQQAYHLPSQVISSITIIAPIFRFFSDEDTLSWSVEPSPAATVRSITIVLLPTNCAQHLAFGNIRYARVPKFWGRILEQLVRDARHYRVRCIGMEYSGLDVEEVEELVADTRARLFPTPANTPPVVHKALSFGRFQDWLGAQETGKVFTASEEAEFREVDQRLLADDDQA